MALSDEMPSAVNSSQTRRPATHQRVFWIILSAVLVVAAVGATIAFRGLGHWLIREDPLAPAGVIVVLSGSMPYRAEEAAAIYRMGYAREVWVSRPDSPISELAEIGVTYLGEEDYSREVLIHEGVPAKAVRILPDPIVDTEQEIREVAREMRKEDQKRAIIVTSPQHTRRVRVLWHLLVAGRPEIIVRAAWQDPFDADHWWRNTRDALAVVRETLGLMNAWTGLPVRPHTQ
ncbi:MAG: YdcF family protein [Candidatus Acidiferrales bacterium]